MATKPTMGGVMAKMPDTIAFDVRVHGVPAGWKLVPLQPTNAMLGAAVRAWNADPLKKSSTLYRAMVEAAPHPPGVRVTPNDQHGEPK